MHPAYLILLGVSAALVALRWSDSLRATRVARGVLLIAASTVMLIPFAWLVCAAFKPAGAIMEHAFLPPISEWGPDTFSLENFRRLFLPRPTLHGPVEFQQYLINSLFVASSATVIQLFLCSLGGYALAKFDFRGRRPLQLVMLGTLMVPHLLFLAPLYRLIVSAGFADSYLAVLVPNAANAFGIFLFRQAMVRVPMSPIEAARIDGASEFFIYLHVVMPLVRPMTAAFCLIVFMGQWNGFIGPQIYLHTGYKLTLPVMLNQYVSQYSEDYGLFLAGTLLAILPVALLFVALQREFIAGLTSGAVKE